MVHLQRVGEHLAVSRSTDGDVLDLRTPVTECDHRLAAGLAPTHGSTAALGEHSEQDFFGIGVDLRAEATADVRSDDAHDLWLDAERRGDAGLGALCVLRGNPLDESAVVPHRCTSAHLERTRSDALVVDPRTNDDVATGEGIVGDAGHAEHRRVDDDVAAHCVVQRNRTGCHRRFHVDVRLEDVVVDDHAFCCVFTLVGLLGEHDCDRLADVAHLAARKQRARDCRVVGRGNVDELEVRRGVDRHDTGHLECIGGVDRADVGVCHGAAHVGHVQRVCEQRLVQHVVDIDPTGGEELRVFLALNSIAEDAAGHVDSFAR